MGTDVLIGSVTIGQVKDLALGLAEPLDLLMGPLLKLVQVPLDGILSLRHVDHTAQLGIVCKYAKGALDPTKSLMKILNSTGPHMDP